MESFLPLAIKSLAIAGGTLLLLKLMQKRSASDRSWVAHLGLLAMLLLPLAAITLPAVNVIGPSFLASDPAPDLAAPDTGREAAAAPLASVKSVQSTQASADQAPVDWAFWTYAVPAALLALLTVIALARLSILKARANVLVDAHWLQALARAQQRMGFKNGTALLTSNELSSPISWGLMRPVILLNTDATSARDEAEAIIAHELAHVAGLDWAKLMLSRITTALFWFNPLVWILAREAHQLREEAADDAVLAANIEDTDYANLLVGIARHECRGILLGAHGVAPARNSLTRRVKRVLDAALDRAPGGWKWSSAAAFFAAGMTVPLAAVQFVAPASASAAEQADRAQLADARSVTADVLTDALARERQTAGRTTASEGLAATGPVASNGASAAMASRGELSDQINATVASVIANARGATVEAAARSGRDMAHASAIDRAIELKAVGVTADYARAMREAAPTMTSDDLIALAAMRVPPAYVRDLVRATNRRLDADDIAQARAIGIDGAYVRGMTAAGYGRLSMDDLTELKGAGVSPADAARYRKLSRGLPSVDTLVAAKNSGLTPEDVDPDDRE